MNEPAKENPKTSRRSKRRPAMEPLGWDEIVSQPGMGGYLSFLNGPVPLPHLTGSPAALVPVPEVVSDPLVESTPESVSPSALESVPEVQEVAGAPSAETTPGIDADPADISNPEPIIIPGVEVDSGDEQIPASTNGPSIINGLGSVRSNPEVVSIPAGRLRIRRCVSTHDGHSLGEEVLYQTLWKAAHPESAEIRTITIGWRGMSQLCRMTPKNCKINTQRLIRKLALQVLSPYNTPESIGTTYRVYSDQAIFERRREAGLEWVVRSRGVEFVNPATGVGILPICAHTHQSGSL